MARDMRRKVMTAMVSMLVTLIAGWFIIDHFDLKSRANEASDTQSASQRRRIAAGISHPVYHHGLRPMVRLNQVWGRRTFSVIVNSLGMRDGEMRDVPLKKTRRRIVIMGDSFTYGVGLPYQQTFAAHIGAALRDVEVLCAGVISHSPKLFRLRTHHLIENVGLEFDELAVFIDISDAQDDIIYADWKIEQEPVFEDGLMIDAVGPWRRPFVERGQWVHNPKIYESWGREGLRLCQQNMDALLELCRAHGIRLTIAIYPWPEQIRRRQRTSPYESTWRQWADSRDVAMLNLTPALLDAGEAKQVVDKYYIAHDVHFNAAGHALIARRWLEFYRGLNRSIKSRDQSPHSIHSVESAAWRVADESNAPRGDSAVR